MIHVENDVIIAKASFNIETKMLSGDVRLAEDYNRVVGKINSLCDFMVSKDIDSAMKAVIEEEYRKVRPEIVDYCRMWKERAARGIC